MKGEDVVTLEVARGRAAPPCAPPSKPGREGRAAVRGRVVGLSAPPSSSPERRWRRAWSRVEAPRENGQRTVRTIWSALANLTTRSGRARRSSFRPAGDPRAAAVRVHQRRSSRVLAARSEGERPDAAVVQLTGQSAWAAPICTRRAGGRRSKLAPRAACGGRQTELPARVCQPREVPGQRSLIARIERGPAEISRL